MFAWRTMTVAALIATALLVRWDGGAPWTGPAGAPAEQLGESLAGDLAEPLDQSLADLQAEKQLLRQSKRTHQPTAGGSGSAAAPATGGAAERSGDAPAGAPSANSDGLAPALAPIDPLMPEPGAVPARWQPLDQVVREVAAGLNGRVSVVAVDLSSKERYEFRPNDRYYPASTFKLPVCICTVEAIERSELAWDTPVTFTEADDDTVGAGGFADAAYGTKWPVRNLLDRSIISSNNVAVKMLARTLTWDGLQACTERLGGMVTRTSDGSTPVTARDEAAWWLAVWQMKQERPKVAENLLSPLRRVTYTGRIQAGTPRPDLVTHKFGTYPPYEHDGAIVWTEKPYLLVVMTYTPDHAAADTAIARVAGAAWQGAQAPR